MFPPRPRGLPLLSRRRAGPLIPIKAGRRRLR
ncbi:hypothetical protein U713_18060 [Rhodobacter capsulatus YW2]|nr:hypothetical protein U703_16655 [Rhodobacter capsulatus YW1]ETD86938.1 hypothetical protein U713_18060 [Rhodobacter capsulatus YW2]